MARPLFLHHLDEAVERGCQTPNCPHDHGSEIFLTPLCHPGVGVRIENLDEVPGLPCAAVVGLRCWRVPPWWGCDAGGVNVPWCRWLSPRALRSPRCVGMGARWM